MFSKLLYGTFTLFIILFIGCTKKEGGDSSNTKDAVTTADNVSELVSVEPRADLAPNFTWRDASGKTVSFDAFRGKVTLVNFWATWCVPCKKEIPDLIALSNELAGKNVKIIGIATDRGLNVSTEIAAFVKEYGITYQILISTEDLETAFNNVRMMPTTFLIDADGKIVQTLVGIRSKQALLESITPLLK